MRFKKKLLIFGATKKMWFFVVGGFLLLGWGYHLGREETRQQVPPSVSAAPSAPPTSPQIQRNINIVIEK